MPRRNELPQLTPSQVVQLQDELLANADRLLQAALAVLDLGNVGLARSLVILGMEESGKAIALHQRRVDIAHEPEGAPFVDAWLKKLWADHQRKLKLVHDFLVEEKYWFGSQPSDPGANAAWLGKIDQWALQHNALKQRGFYVDVDEHEGVLTPAGVPDTASLRQVIDHVHQIGWQLRLGEHIEAKRQKESAEPTPPASEAEIVEMRQMLSNASSVDNEMVTNILDGMRQGDEGTLLNNDAYRLHLPGPGSNPFATMGKPGYEAQTRELLDLAEQIGLRPGETNKDEAPNEDGSH